MKGRSRRTVGNAILRRLPFGLQPLLPPGLVIGRHTYGPIDYDTTFPMYTEGAQIVVGAFCSISAEARILGGGEHAIQRPSTFPIKARLVDPEEHTAPDSNDTGPTVIGNDVYIGVGAVVLSGVTVGDGAVIGAGAVVTKSVDPYAIVAGNPARPVRYRFDEPTRQRLLALQWWDWDDEKIRRMLPWFMGDVDEFLNEAERIESAQPSAAPADTRQHA